MAALPTGGHTLALVDATNTETVGKYGLVCNQMMTKAKQVENYHIPQFITAMTNPHLVSENRGWMFHKTMTKKAYCSDMHT